MRFNPDNYSFAETCYLTVCQTASIPKINNKLKKAIKWYNAAPGRLLSISIITLDSEELTLRIISAIKKYSETKKLHQLTAPKINVYTPTGIALNDRFLMHISSIDTHSPRIELISIHKDIYAFKDPLHVIKKITSDCAALNISITHYFEASSPKSLCLSTSFASRLRRPDTTRTPVIELPLSDKFTPAAATLAIFDLVATLWNTEASVHLSLGGLVKSFLLAKEFHTLRTLGISTKILEPRLPKEYSEIFEMILLRHILPNTMPPILSTVMRNDVDILADSHECQSPFFLSSAIGP